MATSPNPFAFQGVEKRARDAREAFVGPLPGNTVINGKRLYPEAGSPAAAGASAPLAEFRPEGAAQPPVMDEGQRLASRITGGAPAPFSGPNSLSRGAAPRGLGGAAPVPVGRSSTNIDRVVGQMLRRRDPRAPEMLLRRQQQADSFSFQRDMQERGYQRDDFEFQRGEQSQIEREGRQEGAEVRREGRQEGAEVRREGRRNERDDFEFQRGEEAQIGREGRRNERDDFEFQRGEEAQIGREGRQEGAEVRREGRRNERDDFEFQREIDANKGWSVQPLDPNDPSKGDAVVRGDGRLFNLLPGQRAEMTPDQFDETLKRYPDAEVSGRMGGATITRRAPRDAEQRRGVVRNIPGPMTPDPLNPGRMVEGAPVPVLVFEDGTYEPLQPRAVKKPAAQGGAGGGYNPFKK